MRFSVVPQFSKRSQAEALILPLWEGEGVIDTFSLDHTLSSLLEAPLISGDFQGKEGETACIYVSHQKEPRWILLGLGKKEKTTVEILRRSVSAAVRLCHKRKIVKINFFLPKAKGLKINEEEVIFGVGEGLLLTNYKWDQLKGESKEKPSIALLEEIAFIGASSQILSQLKKIENVAEAVYLARDLINGNADDVTPQFLAKVAQNLSEEFPKIKTTVLNKHQIQEAGLGLLLAVGRGSPRDPAFITMEYRGNPRSKECTVLIGKGVTFDTGGLNIKPTGGMETMRDDMSGAAAVIATIAAVASLGLKVNVTSVIAAAENAVDGNSFKPGDVYTSYSGKTIEIGNTDAEGRLTLADAISYSINHLSPTRIINIATLTGSMVIALGEEVSGFMSNNPSLATQLMKASEKTDELIWELPLQMSYKENLKSDVADLKNIGGRPGGAIIAGLFLQEFVGDVPWAHIDIAGTAFGSKERYYNPKLGVGFGVRLLVQFLQQLE